MASEYLLRCQREGGWPQHCEGDHLGPICTSPQRCASSGECQKQVTKPKPSLDGLIARLRELRDNWKETNVPNLALILGLAYRQSEIDYQEGLSRGREGCSDELDDLIKEFEQ